MVRLTLLIVSWVVGLAARLLSALLLFLTVVLLRIALRLLLLLIAWELVSFVALFSPRASAEALTVRLIDWLTQRNILVAHLNTLIPAVRAFVFLGFGVGWIFIALTFVLVFRVVFG